MPNQLSSDARDVLVAADKQPDRVVLRSGRLQPALYREVNQALELLGGSWISREEAHVFTRPYLAKLEAVLNGTAPLPLKNPTAFFPTPAELAVAVIAESVAIASLPAGAKVIEPSGGRGALISALQALRADLAIDACEIDEENREHLREMGVNIVADDFLTLPDEPIYDAAIFNPPFSVPGDKSAWVTHVEKVLRVTKPGAPIVAILPKALIESRDARIAALREMFESKGAIVANPDKSFRESGTDAKTVTAFVGAVKRTMQPVGASALPKPTSENVYWRNVQGRVFEHKHFFTTETGAVIFWMGEEAGAAQGWLKGQAMRGEVQEFPKAKRRGAKQATAELAAA